MNLNELADDPGFKEHWPYCWHKLLPFFLQKQRTYARDHKADHVKVGQFVEFLEEVMSDLESIDHSIKELASRPAKRKRLNNPPPV